jgi:uncharacterized protein (DUF1330 family)
MGAQTKTPGAYAVIDISNITDADTFNLIGPKAGPAATAGGSYIARTNNITSLDGTAPKRLVIIAFDNMDKAKAWYASPAQKEVDALRTKTTKSRVFIAEGM